MNAQAQTENKTTDTPLVAKPFKTNLLSALHAADEVSIDGYAIEETSNIISAVATVSINTMHTEDSGGKPYVFLLGQLIEIDPFGCAVIIDTEGVKHVFSFKVNKPLEEKDIVYFPVTAKTENSDISEAFATESGRIKSHSALMTQWQS